MKVCSEIRGGWGWVSSLDNEIGFWQMGRKVESILCGQTEWCVRPRFHITLILGFGVVLLSPSPLVAATELGTSLLSPLLLTSFLS